MDLDAFRDNLELEIERTKKKISRYEEMSQPIAPDNAIGRVSRMDAINNKGVMDAAKRKAKERLSGLERQLEKLYTPEFGLCAKCRKTIQPQRILLAPESALCVVCAAK